MNAEQISENKKQKRICLNRIKILTKAIERELHRLVDIPDTPDTEEALDEVEGNN